MTMFVCYNYADKFLKEPIKFDGLLVFASLY